MNDHLDTKAFTPVDKSAWPPQLHNMGILELCKFIERDPESYEDYYQQMQAADFLKKRVAEGVQDVVNADFKDEVVHYDECSHSIRCINSEIRFITQQLRADKKELQMKRNDIVGTVQQKSGLNKWRAEELLKKSFIY